MIGHLKTVKGWPLLLTQLYSLEKQHDSLLPPPGDCTWTTPCGTDTICFSNNTGCPVSGSYRVNLNTLCPAGERCEEILEDGDDEDGESLHDIMVMSLLGMTLVVIFLGLFLACRRGMKHSSRYRGRMGCLGGGREGQDGKEGEGQDGRREEQMGGEGASL